MSKEDHCGSWAFQNKLRSNEERNAMGLTFQTCNSPPVTPLTSALLASCGRQIPYKAILNWFVLQGLAKLSHGSPIE